MKRLAILTLTLTVAACSALGRQAFQNPVVNLKDVRVLGLGTTGGQLEVHLGVYNPNNYRLDATRLTYRVAVGDDVRGRRCKPATRLSSKSPSRSHIPASAPRRLSCFGRAR